MSSTSFTTNKQNGGNHAHRHETFIAHAKGHKIIFEEISPRNMLALLHSEAVPSGNEDAVTLLKLLEGLHENDMSQFDLVREKNDQYHVSFLPVQSLFLDKVKLCNSPDAYYQEQKQELHALRKLSPIPLPELIYMCRQKNIQGLMSKHFLGMTAIESPITIGEKTKYLSLSMEHLPKMGLKKAGRKLSYAFNDFVHIVSQPSFCLPFRFL